jgi:primosomal protein N' (replication factor Y)
MQGEFSLTLIDELKRVKQEGFQSILFQNRRGYAPAISCTDCGWIPKCRNCDVSLTWHLSTRKLTCHYCGYAEKVPHECGSCGSSALKTMNFGTEKVEEALQELFPDFAIERMDQDTTRKKNALKNILNKVESGEADVLIGTQMLAKGLDFHKVKLAGIFQADRMLHYPDFRSSERAFQLITQVGGRAGRRNGNGIVLIQTFEPKNRILNQVVENNYADFYATELTEREKRRFPPFVRLIKILIRHKNLAEAQQVAMEMFRTLEEQLGQGRVFGPEAPPVARIRNLYYQQILVKLETEGINLKTCKQIVLKAAKAHKKDKKLDVFKKTGEYICSIGNSNYKDYPTYRKENRVLAEERRRLYWIRHKKDANIKGTPGYYAARILW